MPGTVVSLQARLDRLRARAARIPSVDDLRCLPSQEMRARLADEIEEDPRVIPAVLESLGDDARVRAGFRYFVEARGFGAWLPVESAAEGRARQEVFGVGAATANAGGTT